jgi:hypothetical protein
MIVLDLNIPTILKYPEADGKIVEKIANYNNSTPGK